MIVRDSCLRKLSNMLYWNAILAISLRWIAPLMVKYFFSDIDIFFTLWTILLFSGFGLFLSKNRSQELIDKKNIINISIIMLLTIIHYLGNFYGIVTGNIILTTLILKNSPFIQKIIYAKKYKKALKTHHYIVGLWLIIWVSLLSFSKNWQESFNILHIIIPILSAISRSYLMIFLWTIKKEKELLSIWNFIAGIIILILYSYINWNLGTIKGLSRSKYGILILLGIFPTFLAPILWSTSIKKLGDKIIYLDYITPIITIIWSIFLFNIQLNVINMVGIGIIFLCIVLSSHKNN